MGRGASWKVRDFGRLTSEVVEGRAIGRMLQVMPTPQRPGVALRRHLGHGLRLAGESCPSPTGSFAHGVRGAGITTPAFPSLAPIAAHRLASAQGPYLQPGKTRLPPPSLSSNPSAALIQKAVVKNCYNLDFLRLKSPNHILTASTAGSLEAAIPKPHHPSRSGCGKAKGRVLPAFSMAVHPWVMRPTRPPSYWDTMVVRRWPMTWKW